MAQLPGFQLRLPGSSQHSSHRVPRCRLVSIRASPTRARRLRPSQLAGPQELCSWFVHERELSNPKFLIEQRVREFLLLAFLIRFDDALPPGLGELHCTALARARIFHSY